MKKKLSVLLVLVLAVAISAYSVGGTYAKYTTTANVSGSAQVAKWNIAFNNGSETITDGATFDLGRTLDSNVADKRIAPGTTGSFTFGVSSVGTEVSYSYLVSFTVNNKPSHLKFYSDNSYANEITADGNGVYSVVPATVVAVGASTPENTTVYWKWDFEGIDDDTTDTINEAQVYDSTDTTEGIASATMSVNATLTATQID